MSTVHRNRILSNRRDARTHANAVAAMMETGEISPSHAFLDRVGRDLAEPEEATPHVAALVITIDTSTAQCLRGYGDNWE